MRWDHKQSAKEVVRHVGLKLGFADLLRRSRTKRGIITEHLNELTAADRFRTAYTKGAWVSDNGQESSSGLGSARAAAAKVSAALPELLARIDCQRLLDVGCGDWNWMQDLQLPCDYIGVDVVPEVIEANRRFERPGVTFAVADAIAGPLPKADVALCREVLFHLSFRDGLAVLANARDAALWLLATTDTAIWFNSDSPTGDFRRVNLQRAPYRLPAPVETIEDDAVCQGRVLGLWRTADIPEVLHGGTFHSDSRG